MLCVLGSNDDLLHIACQLGSTPQYREQQNALLLPVIVTITQVCVNDELPSTMVNTNRFISSQNKYLVAMLYWHPLFLA